MTTAARSSLRATIANHPIASFLVIAYAVSWTLTLLLSVSLVFGLLALFGPTLAAVVVTRTEGSFSELRQRITAWRQPLLSYVLALGIPFAVAGIARLIFSLAGRPPDGIGAIGAIELVLFVLIIGEEIGWRGFLQPRLRAGMGLAVAGLTTGVIWTFWHLALYAPEGPLFFLQFASWVVPLAIAMAVVVEGARFSVIVAVVMHGAANLSIAIVLPGVDRETWLVVAGALWWIAAATLVLAAGTRPEFGAGRQRTTFISPNGGGPS
jgi:membrane protease YdiL (CAAX protease family)